MIFWSKSYLYPHNLAFYRDLYSSKLLRHLMSPGGTTMESKAGARPGPTGGPQSQIGRPIVKLILRQIICHFWGQGANFKWKCGFGIVLVCFLSFSTRNHAESCGNHPCKLFLNPKRRKINKFVNLVLTRPPQEDKTLSAGQFFPSLFLFCSNNIIFLFD